jgi:polyisoprenoid-binding protein YceI
MKPYKMLIGLGLLAAVSAQAETATYKIDPVHTQVIFFVSHLGFSNSSGKFHVADGSTLQLDPSSPTTAVVQVKINMDTLDMGDATWKEHLSGDRFFEVKKYPTMEFKSTKVEEAGEGKLKVTGDLTLHGVTKAVVLDTKINKIGPNPMSKAPAAGFSATTHIKRSDFGMTQMAPAIGDDVLIGLEVEASAPK